uniref:High-affinity zinc uptake system protein ZnuA n=1 Tax=Yoonia rhodophyticola TaxID=3137370 RepID=A0AAN0M8D8_9RHOB
MTDIAPIHSLVAQVMGDLGSPDLLLPPGADPHDFALRPSDADKLANSDLIIWVGPELTPWLEDPLNALCPDR